MKPWEFERLDVMEFDKLIEGYNRRQKLSDAKAAYFVSMLYNVQVPAKHRIKVKDIVNALHPKSKVETKREEEEFIREWISEGGEINGE